MVCGEGDEGCSRMVRGRGGRRRRLKDIFDSRWRPACSLPLLPEKKDQDSGRKIKVKV
jgi:hypothetical protein